MAQADRKLLRRALSVELGGEAMRVIKVCSCTGQYLTLAVKFEECGPHQVSHGCRPVPRRIEEFEALQQHVERPRVPTATDVLLAIL